MNLVVNPPTPPPCRFGKHPPAPETPQPANEGHAVEGVEGQARLGFPARGRRGRPVKTQGDFRGRATLEFEFNSNSYVS